MTAAVADVSVLSDCELASALAEWAGHLAAGEATFVDLVGEFDAREAWAGAGILSCAHWLAWKCSLGAAAARERVRVARAVRLLPAISAEFRAGRLSYSQVRALTRVATPETEAKLVECARTSTATQLERLTSGMRRAMRAGQTRDRGPHLRGQVLQLPLRRRRRPHLLPGGSQPSKAHSSSQRSKPHTTR